MTTSPVVSVAPRRVLLVEDDPGDALLVRELLADVAMPIELTHASSVTEAVELFASDVPGGIDCVLLDLHLPGSGADPLAALRQLRERQPGCAICVLTGLDDEHLGAAAMAAGAQDYLVKGKVDGELLTRTMRYSIERMRGERTAVRLAEAQAERAESIRLERGLMPRPLLDGSQFTASPLYRSGRGKQLLGGDFYDAVRCPDGSVHALLGDVAGHGPDEAALGAQLRVAWRALVLSGVGEPAVLPGLQQVLVTERAYRGLFTTVCTLAFVDGQARVRVAGHPPPILFGAGPPTELAHTVGPPLGVLPDAQWPLTPTDLPPSWALLLYSDGLIEGYDGPERTGRLWNTGLLRLLADERLPELETLPASLVERAERLNGGSLTDDVAILLLANYR